MHNLTGRKLDHQEEFLSTLNALSKKIKTVKSKATEFKDSVEVKPQFKKTDTSTTKKTNIIQA